MIVLKILKIFVLGTVGQIVIWSLLTLIGSPRLGGQMYWLWVDGADWLFPPGPGSHAFPGGAMLGLLVGFLTYALVIGFAINYLIMRQLRNREDSSSRSDNER
jgi:hypothetical protein